MRRLSAPDSNTHWYSAPSLLRSPSLSLSGSHTDFFLPHHVTQLWLPIGLSLAQIPPTAVE